MREKLNTSVARARLADLVDGAEHRGERVILRRRNRDVAAIVPMEDLELIQHLEDRMDVEDALRALKEPRGKPWKQLKAELGL